MSPIKVPFQHGKKMTLALVAVMGTACAGGKSTVGQARAIADEQTGLDRAAECEKNNLKLAKLAAVGPFEVSRDGSSCKIKATKLGPNDTLPEGLELPSAYGADDCAALDGKFKAALKEWEGSAKLSSKVFCDKDGKPTTDLDAIAKLFALEKTQTLFSEVLPQDPAAPKLQECVEAVRDFAMDSDKEKQTLRCEVLTNSAAIGGMTSKMLLSLMHMDLDEFDETGATLKPFKIAVEEAKSPEDHEAAEKRLETETMTLIKGRKAKLCGEYAPMTAQMKHKIYTAAIMACMTRAGGGVSKATSVREEEEASTRAARREKYEELQKAEKEAKQKAELEELKAKLQAGAAVPAAAAAPEGAPPSAPSAPEAAQPSTP